MENQQMRIVKPNSGQQATKPLLSLVDILLSLAEVYRFTLTERAMNAYVLALGHRTDEDLNAAYSEILRTRKMSLMPTPAEIREACPVMRVRRDGSKA